MALFLPKKLRDLRDLLQALDWHTLEREVEREARTRLVIVGPVNSGKSTLFNRLHGQALSAVRAVPGTTQGVIEHPLGPFFLVDTPGFGEVWGVDRSALALEAARRADVILLLLDAVAGVRQSDYDLFVTLKRLGKPLVVALNKTDLVKKDLPWVLENAQRLLGVTPIPISAQTGRGIAEHLVPALLEAQPALQVALAQALPGQRRRLVERIIRSTAFTNALIALQPVPGLDVPLLAASQTRMVLRIAAAYGQRMDASHASEFIVSVAGTLLVRFGSAELAKLVPVLGWLVSGSLVAAGTWAMGMTAVRYFEAPPELALPDLKRAYRTLRGQAWKALRRAAAPALAGSGAASGAAQEAAGEDAPARG